MRLVRSIQAAKAGTVALSAALCGLGLLMLLHPALSIRVTGAAVGGLMLAFGAVKLVGYFSGDLYRLAFQFDLAFGLLLIALGALVLARPVRAMNTLCVILGIEIVADGLFKVQTALDARRFGLASWWLILALGAVTGAAGIAVAVQPSESAEALTALTGAALLAEGALNLCVALCAVKIIHPRPDILEPGLVEGER